MPIIYLKAIVIGIVEGLTEFIPISSTGHMILIGNIIRFTGEKAATFEVFVQMGAILAVAIIYKDRFLGLIPVANPGKRVIRRVLDGDSMPTVRHLIFAIVPFLIVGFVLHKTIKGYLFNPSIVSAGLIVGGVVMILVERLPIKKTVTTIDDFTLKHSFFIGLGQCFAVWPGISRSGATIVTGLLIGVKHKPVADFSFIIAVPVMCAAVGYDMFRSIGILSLTDLPVFLLGFFVSFVVGWASVKWFLRVLVTIRLIPFGIYRILLGSLALWYFH